MNPDSSQTASAGVAPSPDGDDHVASQNPAEVTAVADDAAGVAVYRTAGGWRVGQEELPDLVNAMTLADLLAGETPAPARPSVNGEAGAAAETARLKVTIAQLEHALANRVRVEQAIGTLAERHRVPPRQAFELLRGAARARGRRVHDLAGEVVQSITNPLLPLPEELARPPRAQRSRGRPRPA